jgi:hypothetical protein
MESHQRFLQLSTSIPITELQGDTIFSELCVGKNEYHIEDHTTRDNSHVLPQQGMNRIETKNKRMFKQLVCSCDNVVIRIVTVHMPLTDYSYSMQVPLSFM